MTTTPDGISFAALQDMLSDAPKEAEGAEEEMTRERIEEIADQCLTMAQTLGARGPLVHKVMMVMTLSNLIDWHTRIGENMIEDGQPESARAWLRDAGKCQSIVDILYTVQCGEDDYLTNE